MFKIYRRGGIADHQRKNGSKTELKITYRESGDDCVKKIVRNEKNFLGSWTVRQGWNSTGKTIYCLRFFDENGQWNFWTGLWQSKFLRTEREKVLCWNFGFDQQCERTGIRMHGISQQYKQKR